LKPYIFHITLYDAAFFGMLFIGLNFALLLWFTKKANRSANRFLAMALAVAALWIARLLAIDIGLGAYAPFWSRLPLQYSLALGPLIYFYVLKITRPEYKFLRKDLLHFSPLLLKLGAYIPETVESAKTGTATYNTLMFQRLNPVLLVLAFISVSIYLYKCHALIKKFYRQQKFTGGDRYRHELRWLHRLLIGFGLLWLLWIPFTAAGYYYHLGAQVYYPLYFLLMSMIIWMAATAHLRPDFVMNAEAAPILKPLLPAELKQKGIWLKNVVKEQRYYQDPELSLGSLAEKLDLSNHELSRIINTVFKKSFNDFINEYRVKEVAAKMQDPAYDHITLLGIAYESGFNSQTTFTRILKRMTGKSPLEFKNDLKKDYPYYNLDNQQGFARLISYHETTPKWSDKKLNRNYMFRNYLKIAWRNIVRHKAYSAINIAGLTVGIAACLLIFLVVRFELSFDDFQAKNIYRVVTQINSQGNTRYTAGISAPAVDAFRLRFPQAKVAGINLIYGSEVTVPTEGNNSAASKKFIETSGIMFAEPQLFDILSSRWLAGNPSALKEPNMVVIDESHAAKYFGDWHSAIGKTLHVDNLLTLKVAGVLRDPPVNSDFRLNVLISYITWKQHAKDYGYFNNWDNTSSGWQVFIRFPENVLKSNIDRQLRDFSDQQWNNKKRTDRQKYAFAQPLSDLHFDTRFRDGLGDHVTSMATLRTLSFIAILIVVMASINFINLSTAQSVGRSKEVGIRKVLGSSRGQLVVQVMGETTIIVLISAALGALLAEFALPFLKNIDNVPDSIGLFNGSTLFNLAVVVFIVIILSGIYPALIVSGFKPVLALKNKINAASVGGISLRRILVITQFSISQLLIIGTVIAIKQMDFVNNADLGFDKNAVLIIPCTTDSIGLSRLNSFKQEVVTLPGVQTASFISDAPSSDNNNSTDFYFNHLGKVPGFSVFTKEGDADYFKTFGLRFVAGRGYQQSDTVREVVINETLMHKLGIKRPEDALGKSFSFDNSKWAPIVGVVEDFKTNSMREEVKPVVIYPQKQSESEIGVKIETAKLAPTAARIQKLWENHYPEYAYAGFFLDDSIAKFYKQENQLELVYKSFALIAIFISCLGLYGLVSFMVVQRTKEMGIRKVLGASMTNIMFLFSKEFLSLIIIAFLIAAPVGWYMMKGWLQSFAYRITIGVDIFLIAMIASLSLGWFTVGYKAIKAALANPVKSLRSE